MVSGQGQPHAHSIQADTSSREVAALVETIARLADGNCASKADVELMGGDAQTRAVRLGLKVALTWTSSSKSYAGEHAVDDSQLCSSVAHAQRYLEQVCGPACRQPSTSKRVADLLGKSPVAALDAYADGCDLGVLPHRAHHLENCGSCRGHGAVTCPDPGCTSGQVGCVACNLTGQATCSNCQGSGHISEGGRYHTCGRCHGSGRSGNCNLCLGRGHVTCQSCRGTGEVGCKPCAGTGCYTRIYSTNIQGRVSRSLGVDAGAPDGFRRSCQAVAPKSALAMSVGSLVRAEVTSAAGEVNLTLHCQVRHVQADMACDLERIHVDALGPGLAVPLMPTFLDGLTCELANSIRIAAARAPAQALASALKSRLTRDVLAAVGRGPRPDISAIVRGWSGAVSDGHIRLLATSLETAYGKAARSPVRRAWLLLSPLIVVGSALSNAYQLPYWLLHHLHPTVRPSLVFGITAVFLAELVAVLPVVLLAWVVAGQVGRRQLRTGVGGLARRRPRQGRWPVLGLLLEMVSGWSAAALRLDAAPMGLPLAPVARPDGVSLTQALGGKGLAAAGHPGPSADINPPAVRPQVKQSP